MLLYLPNDILYPILELAIRHDRAACKSLLDVNRRIREIVCNILKRKNGKAYRYFDKYYTEDVINFYVRYQCKEINLSGEEIKEHLFCRLIANNSKITKLKGGHVTPLSNNTTQMITGLHKLRHLALYNCNHLDNNGLQMICSMTNLTTLEIGHAHRIKDEETRCLANLHQLKKLTLAQCSKIGIQTIEVVSGMALELLSLVSCYQLTDDDLKPLIRLKSRLRELNLNNLWEITHVMMEMVSEFENLRVLHILFCDRLR